MTIFLLLAFLLGAYPAYRRFRLQTRCEPQSARVSDATAVYSVETPDQVAPCVGTAPHPDGLARGLGILSLLCLAGAAVSLGSNYLERRREYLLLRQAGVPIREEDLPLEE